MSSCSGTGYRDGEQAGFSKGEAAGISQGVAEEKLRIARNLRNQGFPIEAIAKATSLSEKEVEAIG